MTPAGHPNVGRRERRRRVLRPVPSLATAIVLLAGAAAAAAVGESSRTSDRTVVVWTRSGSTISVPGNSTIYDLGSHNTILGGAGNNDIYPGPGDDVHGGHATNAVLYTGTSAPVTVTLDNLPNDGVSGEDDNVHTDVEQLYGGRGDNRLIGDLRPGAPDELIQGGAGRNYLVGGSGHNRIYAGPGVNTINSFNGKVDVVVCDGRSTVEPDAFDTLVNCRRRVAPPHVNSPIDYTFSYTASSTSVRVLTVRGVPRGGSVEVRCHGGGCPFGRRQPKLRHGAVALAALFGHSPLAPGATLEILITKPNIVLRNAIGKVDLFTMGRDAPPTLTRLCLPPGVAAPLRAC
jgi:Ca2+-binding RTX toxin-like protein